MGEGREKVKGHRREDLAPVPPQEETAGHATGHVPCKGKSQALLSPRGKANNGSQILLMLAS